MGGQVSKIMGKLFGSREMRLLMLGLDAAGKTSKTSHSLAPIGLPSNERTRLTILCSHPLQAQIKSRRHNYPHRWIQRRDCHIQERQIQCLGCWRTRQDKTLMETLLFWYGVQRYPLWLQRLTWGSYRHTRSYLRHRLERPKPHRRG